MPAIGFALWLPTSSAVGDISEVAIPTPGSAPSGIVQAADGSVWFTESAGNKVGTVSPTGVVSEYPVPTAGATPRDITTGSDGNLWAIEANAPNVVKITPSGTVTEIPDDTGAQGNSITAGPDGNLWFTDHSRDPQRIVQVTTAGVFTHYNLAAGMIGPQGITSGSDGNLWFCEYLANKIGRITTAGTITEFAIPTGNSGPFWIASDGMNLWFTEQFAGKIGRITTAGAVREFTVPGGANGLSGIAAAPDGAMWFTNQNAPGSVGRIDPTGAITSFNTPTAHSAPFLMAGGGAASADMWFTEPNANKVGRVRAIPQPIVTSVNPNSGPNGGGGSVTITGSGFIPGVSASVSFGGRQSDSVRVTSPTSIQALTPPSGLPNGGTVDVTVTTSAGTSMTSAADHYTYFGTPTVTSLTPNSGFTAGGNKVTIAGTNLAGASKVVFGATNASSFTVNSNSSITATAPAHTPGSVEVQVTTPGGTSAPNPPGDQYAYTLTPAPSVTSVNPTAGPAKGGNHVTVGGTNFTGASTVSFGGTKATSFTVTNGTTIDAVAPAHTAGPVDIQVTTAGGTSRINPAADRYAYNNPPPPPLPTVSAISPTQGPTAGGTVVHVTGTNLVGVTQVDFGNPASPGTAATSITMIDATHIDATSPSAPAGPVALTVATGAGRSPTSPADVFTYIAPPMISGLNPSSGPIAGGTVVTISGTGLTGATSVTFGASLASSFTSLGTGALRATAPPAPAGTVDVRVTTVSGGTSAIVGADRYTYVAPPLRPPPAVQGSATPPPAATPTPSPSAAPTASPPAAAGGVAGVADNPTPQASPATRGQNQGSPRGSKGGSLRSDFVRSLPSPAAVLGLSATAALVSAAIALGAALVVLFPSHLFNSTVEENYEEIRGWFSFIPTAGTGVVAQIGEAIGRIPTLATVAVYIVVMGALYAVLDPGFGWSLGSLALFLGMVGGVFIVTLGFRLPGMLHLRLRHGLSAAVKTLPWTVLVAGLCVAVSRLAHFQPGYLYGLVAGFAIQGELSKRHIGRSLALGSAVMFVISYAAWIAWVPILAAAAQPDPSFLVLVLDALLAVVFVAGLETMVFGLLPMRFLDGHKIAAWSKLAWVALFAVGIFGLVHVLIAPKSGYFGRSLGVTEWAVLTVLGVFASVSIGLWAYFRFRSPRTLATDAGVGTRERAA